MSEHSRLLGGLDVATFLERHWQKLPLLVRDALSIATPPISADELAGLACEDEVESRIVFTHPSALHLRDGARPPARVRVGPFDERDLRPQPAHAGEAPYTVRYGPFEETEFTALPAHDWTLLVQDCDKHVPELARFLEPFRFVPDWRIDDLMVSYASDGGGVGPHRDRYDVFLLQVAGQRRWQIGAPRDDLFELPGLELAILGNFRAEQEWVLGPGDLLYLPPGVPHNGVALGECMTFSIGFRAPSERAMLSDLFELLHQGAAADATYADPDLTPDQARPPGRIAPQALARVRATLRRHLEPTDAQLDEWFARFVTEPKPQLRSAAPDRPLDQAALTAAVRAGRALLREPRSLFAWYESAGGELTLAVDGTAFQLPAQLREIVVVLCAERRFAPDTLQRYLDDPAALRLLAALHALGALDLEGE